MNLLDNPERTVVGRLAPSPTGGLHLGHARTFLVAWLAARQAGGRMILRIEDLDASRVRPGAREGAVADLRWLGFDWDHGPDVGGPAGPYVQSERTLFYDRALDQLKAGEWVYPCTCTRAEVARAASAPHADEEGPVYPGTCASRRAADALALTGRPFAWRSRTPAETIVWNDLFQGRIDVSPDRLGGDFIVARHAVGHAYQLAVVVDDHAMGVTQVIRGLDLIPSTPRQILLYRRLGWSVPDFGHVPLAVDGEGRRLAKRSESLKLETLRAAGADPRRLIGLLAQSCGWSSVLEPSRPGDWIGRVDPAAIPGEPWVVPHDLMTRLII